MSYVSTADALWGAGSMVLGTLLVTGLIGMPFGALALGVLLLVAGVLMMMDTVPGPSILGGVLFVTGLLLLIGGPFGAWLGRAILDVVPLVAGILLLVAGLVIIWGRRVEDAPAATPEPS